MNFVIFDFEWNTAYSKKDGKYINEIIDIGAVKLSSDLKIIDEFSMLIRPQIKTRLNYKVKELTSISDEEVTNALTFYEVYDQFKAFAKDSILISWGKTDLLTLLDNCDYYYEPYKITYANKYVDLQEYCNSVISPENKSMQIGLSPAANKLNIDFDKDNLHRAIADSYLTAKCFKKLYDKNSFENEIKQINDEFYERLTFKVSHIINLANPLINKKDLMVKCTNCGKWTKRQDDWIIKSKSFCAKFNCKKCDIDYSARIKFKVLYEGVKVKKNVNVIEKVETTT